LRSQERISAISENIFVTEEAVAGFDVGIGDDVFMIGRFLNHQGKTENRPAARFGSISMMPEPIYNSVTKRDQLSYAVEMRSRTGFSGSPVCFYRSPGTSLKELRPEQHSAWGFLGVNWGYILDEGGENTWLNGVVPAWKLLELFETDPLKRQLQAIDEAIARSGDNSVAMPAVTVENISPPTTGDNPKG
jgi:hypothetical protein